MAKSPSSPARKKNGSHLSEDFMEEEKILQNRKIPAPKYDKMDEGEIEMDKLEEEEKK